MFFRPGSLIAAFAHGYGLMRKATNPPVDEAVVVLHKASHNYSSVSAARYTTLDQSQFELVARIYKHNGPELSNMKWDVDP